MASTAGQVINGLAPGIFKTLCKVQPTGALQARKEASGAVAFFWRYTIGTKSERVRIGLYAASAPPKSLTETQCGYSVAAATRAAETLAIEHHKHRDVGGRPALLAADREAKAAAESAAQRAATHTLISLLKDYCDYLQSLGRRSHKDARSIFELHVKQPWPNLALAPANQVSGEQFADMMRRLIEAGKGRTANKLRSYARAAYQTALASKSKPSIPVAFKAYAVHSNPVADTTPDDQFNRTDKRPLDLASMRAYWREIKNLSGFRGAVLRVHLLTGAQRIEQLVNLKTAAVAPTSITLLDGKGRPGKPARPHSIPLTLQAAKALEECAPGGTWALSTDGGETHLAATTLSKWAADAAKVAGIEDFQAKRIRSGVETLLAASRVSREHRGRLQSHGVSGVQARHYDGHEYMVEKRQALSKLIRLLDQQESNEGASRPLRSPGQRRGARLVFSGRPKPRTAQPP